MRCIEQRSMNLNLTHTTGPLTAEENMIWKSYEETRSLSSEHDLTMSITVLDLQFLRPFEANPLFWHPVLNRLLTHRSGTVWDAQGNVVYAPVGGFGFWAVSGNHYIFKQRSTHADASIVHILDHQTSIHHRITGSFSFLYTVNPVQPYVLLGTRQIEALYAYESGSLYTLPAEWRTSQHHACWSHDGAYLALVVKNAASESLSVIVCTKHAEHVYTYPLSSDTAYQQSLETHMLALSWHPRQPLLAIYRPDWCEWVDIHGNQRWCHYLTSTPEKGNFPPSWSRFNPSIQWNPQGTLLGLNCGNYITFINAKGQIAFIQPSGSAITAFTWHPSGQFITVALENTCIETYHIHGTLVLSHTTCLSSLKISYADFIPVYVAWNALGTSLATSLRGFSTLLYTFSFKDNWPMI